MDAFLPCHPYFSNLFMANLSIWPDFCGPLVTGFVGSSVTLTSFSLVLVVNLPQLNSKYTQTGSPTSKNGLAWLLSLYIGLYLFLFLVLQAFQKLDKEKKRQELEKIRETYGISKDK